MNQKYDDQQNTRAENTSVLEDDLQTEKSQQNSAKLNRDEQNPE